MRKLIFGSAILFLLANCSSNGASEKSNEDSSSISDSIAKGEAVMDTVQQIRLDTLKTDSNKKTEDESFYKSLPNIKKLAVSDHRKETKYLHSLGFKGSFKEKGMDEDWQANGTFTLEKGQRKCVVKAHVDGYYEDYKITITGDDEAKEKYYKETKKITRTQYGSPIKTKLKGNTITVTIQGD